MQNKLPFLALRDTVIFPEAIEPLLIGRNESINTVCNAYDTKSNIIIAAQKDPSIEEIVEDNLYKIGTIGQLHNLIKLSDGTVKLLLVGVTRVRINKLIKEDDLILANYSEIKIKYRNSKLLQGLKLVLLSTFDNFCKQSNKIPIDILQTVTTIDDPSKLCDTIASYLPLRTDEQQEILELLDVKKRIEKLIFFMESQNELFLMEKKIKNSVKKQVEKNQREYYLGEQLKAINQELGNTDNTELIDLEKKITSSLMPKNIKDKALNEVKKIKSMAPLSQESTVIRTYLDNLIKLPWTFNKEDISLSTAEQILNKNHFGLEKIKERILEYIAVYMRTKKVKSQILCFVGPPGVGKTSLGKSIADSLNRSFIRIALGGVSDEAEIRGHRKTYVGAMPGKIIQAMQKVSFTNPVILLDEIDKLGYDGRSDPYSALLEVLDPEQNNTFTDNYLEAPYDLSNVIFIATANSYEIPLPLLDRMEILQLTGYTEEEKLKIATQFIIPKQKKENGLKIAELKIPNDVINIIIRDYTMESGVRNLEREIAKISRKTVRKLIEKEEPSVTVSADNISDFLGPKKYIQTTALKDPTIGVVMGLAWTEMGGDVLTIEALKLPGTGQLITTGKLGEVMQESVKAAYSFVKSQAKRLKIKESDFSKCDIHIHVPEGAVPKDGPSAGITICTAITSALTGKKVKSDIAMTGEITLVGKILGIGGLKEKLLAARRSGIKTVLIPEENKKDLIDLSNVLIKNLDIKCVSHINDVFKITLIN